MHPDSSVVVEPQGKPQGVAVNKLKWIAIDPMGGRHHLEAAGEGEYVHCRGGDVHPWILQEVQAGRVGRIYGWDVKAE